MSAAHRCPNCGGPISHGPLCATCVRTYAVALVTLVTLLMALVWLTMLWKHGGLPLKFPITRDLFSSAVENVRDGRHDFARIQPAWPHGIAPDHQ